MQSVPISLFCLLLCLNLNAQQYREQFPEGLLLLRSDSIFALNYRSDGVLDFVPFYSAPYLDSIGALAYDSRDNFYYGIRYDNAHLVKFHLNGRYEDLGIPTDSSGKKLPNEDLTSAVIHARKLYVLSYSTNSIYVIDLDSRKFKLLIANIPFALPNSLAWHPVSEKLYILDQNAFPIVISPKTGIIEKNYYTGAFANLPRKKLLSYGKLWFGNDGRCFLLAGQEGILYELDTEKRFAYYIADLNFNSPKDAVPHAALSSPQFIAKELLSLKVQPYQHQSDYLELEWYERNDKAEVAYYYTEKYNPEKLLWEQVAQVPGYAINTQSNRYTYLDRMPRQDENCYRLRTEFPEGFVAYSREVCFDKKSEKTNPKIRLSNSLVSDENGSFLHLIGYHGKKISVEIFHCASKQKTISLDLLPQGDDYSTWLRLEKAGWYEIRIINGKDIQRLKVFK
jgi:hypothetical protein